jgi:putative transposase
VKGKWVYLYRAVDSHGDTLDFMLSERRDEEAATAFFKQAINNNGKENRIKNNVFGKVYTFKADHDLIFYENWKRRANYLKNHLDL